MSSSHFPDTVQIVNEKVRVLTLWEDGIRKKDKTKQHSYSRPPAGHSLCLAVDKSERLETIREGRRTLSFDHAGFMLLRVSNDLKCGGYQKET